MCLIPKVAIIRLPYNILNSILIFRPASVSHTSLQLVRTINIIAPLSRFILSQFGAILSKLTLDFRKSQRIVIYYMIVHIHQIKLIGPETVIDKNSFGIFYLRLGGFLKWSCLTMLCQKFSQDQLYLLLVYFFLLWCE